MFWDAPVCILLELDHVEYEIDIKDIYCTDVEVIKKEVLDEIKERVNKTQLKDVKEFLDQNFTEIKYI